ncbi:MAG: hypothetical protein GY906_37090 [bacterium]|nr:hypothetical protein [bacterium]
MPRQTEYQFSAPGAVAGPVTVAGILANDQIRSVLDVTNGVTLTDEFTVTADNTIDNTGGTSTAAAFITVNVFRPDPRGYIGPPR